MSNLNDIKGFKGVVHTDHDGYMKAWVQNERFWLRDCKKDPFGVYTGIVDNELVMTVNHGLKLGDEVEFELLE